MKISIYISLIRTVNIVAGPDFDLESHVVLNHQRPDVVLFAIGCEALYEGRDRVVFQGETEGGQGLHVV